jgi:hypothetical protein
MDFEALQILNFFTELIGMYVSYSLTSLNLTSGLILNLKASSESSQMSWGRFDETISAEIY